MSAKDEPHGSKRDCTKVAAENTRYRKVTAGECWSRSTSPVPVARVDGSCIAATMSEVTGFSTVPFDCEGHREGASLLRLSAGASRRSEFLVASEVSHSEPVSSLGGAERSAPPF